MTIENVEPQTFDRLRDQLSAGHEAEITASIVAGNHVGKITGHGVTANYLYNPGQKSLTVDITKRPFFVPVSVIENQLRDAVNKAAA